MKKITALVTLLMLIPTPVHAAQAGQYCKTKDAMKIVKLKSTILQCELSGSRYRWKAVK
jgi:hypothetical protein